MTSEGHLPCTLFQDCTQDGPHDAKICRIIASGAFSVMFPTNTVIDGPSTGSEFRLFWNELRSEREELLLLGAEPLAGGFWWGARGWGNGRIGGPPIAAIGGPANICFSTIQISKKSETLAKIMWLFSWWITCRMSNNVRIKLLGNRQFCQKRFYTHMCHWNLHEVRRGTWREKKKCNKILASSYWLLYRFFKILD